MRLYFLFIIFLLISKISFSQGTVCQMEAGCSDTPLEFSNTVGVLSAESGPNYDCLISQPNPAWYFLGFDEVGDIDIEISQVDEHGTPTDVDFICYGPFNDPFIACDNLSILNATNTIDCSYSISTVEMLNIPNAQLDQFYILLVTNYADTSGNITMTQTNSGISGAGSTDCSYACSVDIGEVQSICLDSSYEITTKLGNSSMSDTATYKWYKKVSGIYQEIIGETNNSLSIISASVVTTDMYKVEVIASLCEETAVDEIIINTVDVISNFKLNDISDIIMCDNNNDGLDVFDLRENEDEIANLESASDYRFTYFKNADLTGEISTPSSYYNTTAYTEIIYVTIHNTFIGCESQTQFTIKAIDSSVATSMDNWSVCDNLDNLGFYEFDFGSLEETILNGQDGDKFGVSFHISQENAENGNFPLPLLYTNQNANTSEEIFIRIFNKNITTCFDTTSFSINVNKLPIAHPIENWIICDDYSNDGFEFFDLSSLYLDILNGQDETKFSISFYNTQMNADNKNLAIDLNYINKESFTEEEIFIRIENNENELCYKTTSFFINVIENPIFDIIEDTKYICQNLIDQSVDIQLDNIKGNYIFELKDASEVVLSSTISNEPFFFTITQKGEYTITAKTTGAQECTTIKEIHILPAEPTTNIDFLIDEYWDKENFAIDISVTGTGVYQYALDDINGTYQEDTMFLNVQPGVHVVFVKEMNDCGIVSKKIDLFGFTNNFTPNGDGINDIWKVQGINFTSTQKILIFDRYGKLIQMFYPGLDQGWNGDYNGKPVSEGEYWFTAEMTNYNGDPFIRTGHFSLLRRTNN